MVSFVEQISYHVLVVILPFLIYQLFIKEEEQARRKIFSKLMGVSFITLILTMLNPLEFSEGYLYDFRVIPIIFMFLFGGVWPGITILVTMLLFKYISPGHGFLMNLVNYSIATFFLIILKQKLDSYSIVKKFIVISLFYWMTVITRAISFIIEDQISQIPFTLTFSFITWATLILLIFIIRSLDQQLIYYNQVQQAERLNVVSQLAASVAHEVRNPMTSIKGFLQLIKKEDNLNENQRKYIEISLTELERTEVVIHDYLSLAKPTNKSIMTKLDLTSELYSMIDIMTSYTNTHSIIIKSSIEEGLSVMGKENEFKQAILNIMKNSVEAMDTNGTLEVNAFKNRDTLYIEIKDNGMGMSKKQLEQIGSPYYSTKDKGTGVGLTIAYKNIRELKGKVSVQSEKGVGTTFTIELPST